MYHGDRSRKEVLVEYGFRLPSALDNRPLNFEEWEARVGQLVYVSATPGPYELHKAGGVFVEQVIRPTGLMDPPIEVRPVKGQVDDLLKEIRERAERKERVLVTTLTKRMAEDLTHVLPGARRQGPLPALGHRHARARRDPARPAPRRVRRAGRHQPAARRPRPAGSVAGRDSRRRQGRLPALGRRADPDLGPRRAQRQRPRHHVCRQDDRLDARRRSTKPSAAGRGRRAYNEEHGITPTSIVKAIDDVLSSVYDRDYSTVTDPREPRPAFRTQAELEAHIATLDQQMKAAAANLDFEKAASLRDQIRALRTRELGLGPAHARDERDARSAAGLIEWIKKAPARGAGVRPAVHRRGAGRRSAGRSTSAT